MKMMREWLQKAGVALVLWSGLLSMAPAQTIVWGSAHFPPFTILRGEHRNQGITDYVRGVLIQGMPDYEHTELEAPIPRIANELQNGNNWCWVGAIKNAEREQFARFSVPFGLFVPQKIIVRRDRREEIEELGRGPDGVLELSRLLSQPRLRTMVLRGRSYNQRVDTLIAARGTLPGYSAIPEAMQMLLARRLDYVIEYPPTALFHAEQQGQYGILEALAFREMSEVVEGYIACPRNAWGEKVLGRINQILRKERRTEAYGRALERWNHPSDLGLVRARFAQLLSAE